MFSALDFVLIAIELLYLKHELDIGLLEAVLSIFIYVIIKFSILLLSNLLIA